jgi:hypothetical protein
MNGRRDVFFVGWAKTLPRALRGFLLGVALAVLAGAGAAGVLLSATVDDPGGGDFLFDDGPQSLRGAVTALPYPVLHLPPDATRPAWRSVLLSGVGKTGVEADPALEGRLVEASGFMLRRGPVEQMQVERPELRAAADALVDAPPVAPLGRWRLTGEICDGKCWNGAMRPGAGISHRACANLCLIGGIPPLFVTTRPVEGSDVLLLGGADGGPMPQAMLDWVGLRVVLEGELERRGGLLVFRADPGSARRPGAATP